VPASAGTPAPDGPGPEPDRAPAPTGAGAASFLPPAPPAAPASAAAAAPAVRALRERLDRVDDALVDLVAERLRVVAELFAAKSSLGAPLLDPERERAVVTRLAARARAAGLAPEVVERIYRGLFDESHRLHDARAGALPPGHGAGPAR